MQFQLELDPQQVEITRLPTGYDRIRVEGFPNLSGRDFYGMPALPYVSKLVLIPPGMRVAAVRAAMRAPHVFRGEILPEYVEAEDSWEHEWVPEGPDSTIYNGTDPFPPFDKELARQGSLRGFRLARVALYPVEYVGARRELTVYRNFDLTIELEPVDAARATTRLRPDRRLSRERFELGWLRGRVMNGDDIDRLYGHWLGNRQNQGLSIDETIADAGFNPTEKPSLEGSPVDCVILTNGENIYGKSLGGMVEAWEPWADWKTEKGTPAVIKTVDWVRENYPAPDAPESIRQFLHEAYTLWGTDWVILGGDVEVVPARARTIDWDDTSWPAWAMERDIPADYYYSELDSDWNSDDDAIFGDDSADIVNLDMHADLWVGRIPARDSAEVSNIIAKLQCYTRNPDYEGSAPDTSFYRNVLIAAGLTNRGDHTRWSNGLKHAEAVWDTIEALPGGWRGRRYYAVLPESLECIAGTPIRCYDGTHGLIDDWTGVHVFDMDDVRDQIETGKYQLFYHHEHSYRWSMGGVAFENNPQNNMWPPTDDCAQDPDCDFLVDPDACNAWRSACWNAYISGNVGGHFTRERVMNLTNAPYYGIWVSLGSHTSASDQDAVSEASIRAPSGGSIAYLGRYSSRAVYSAAQSDPSVQREFIGDAFHSGLPFGTALAFAAADVETVYANYSGIAALDWHLLGDPEIRAWREPPTSLNVLVDFSPAGTKGLRRITVDVSDGGLDSVAVSGAVVCLTQGTRFWARGETDGNGRVTFPDALLVLGGNVTVTVTEPAHIPYQQNHNDPDFLDRAIMAYKGHTLSDLPDSSSTLDVLEPGDLVDLDVVLKNVGMATQTVVQDSSVWISGSGGMQATITIDDVYDHERINLGAPTLGEFPHPPGFASTFNLPLHEYGISLLAGGEPAADTTEAACYLWRDPGPDFRYFLRASWPEADSTTGEISGILLIDGGIGSVDSTEIDAADDLSISTAAACDPDTLTFAFYQDGTDDVVSFKAGLQRWMAWQDSTDVFSKSSYTGNQSDTLSYQFRLLPGFKDYQPISFVMSWCAQPPGGGVDRHFSEFRTEVHAPDVRLLYQDVSKVAGACNPPEWERLLHEPYLINLGSVAAENLTLTFTDQGGDGYMIDSVATVSRLDPGEVEAVSGSLLMCVDDGYSCIYAWDVSGPVEGETVLYAYEDWVHSMVPSPVEVDSLRAEPVPEGIRITWALPDSVDPVQFRGYMVLRDSSDVLTILNRIPIEGMCRHVVYDPQIVDGSNEFIPYVFGVSIEYRSGTLGPVEWADTCYANPPEASGWPRLVEKGGVNSIAAFDVDGDSRLELFASGQVISAFEDDGSNLLAGGSTLYEPTVLNNLDDPYFVPEIAVGRLESPASAAVVVAAHRADSLYAIGCTTGAKLWSKPVSIGAVGPTLADLNQDGDLEVLIPARANPEAIYAFQHDGTPYRTSAPNGLYVEVDEIDENDYDAWPFSTLAVADLVDDGYGDLEIVHTPSNYRGFVYCWHGRQADWGQQGNSHARHWKTTSCYIGGENCPYLLSTPSIGDIETGYGEKEVVITRDGYPDELFVLDGQSGGTCPSGHTHRWHFGADTLLFHERNPARVALADLGGPQGDDHLEMVVSVVSDAVRERLIGRHEAIIASIPIDGYSPPQGGCTDSLAWTLCSAWLPLEWRWAEKLPDIGPSPVIADIDRDGTLEIILASLDGAVFIWEAGFQSADSTYFCRPKMAWPLKVIDEATTPIVADIDDDDCLEIVIGDESGMVHVYELPGMSTCETVTAADIPWPMASANAQRTGDYGTGSSMQEGVVLETHGPGFDLPAPNPFNPVVRLRYQIPYPARVEVAVYDVAGRKVRGLFHGRAEAGAHDLIWDGRDEAGRQVASGVYYAVVEMGGSRMTQKLTLLK